MFMIQNQIKNGLSRLGIELAAQVLVHPSRGVLKKVPFGVNGSVYRLYTQKDPTSKTARTFEMDVNGITEISNVLKTLYLSEKATKRRRTYDEKSNMF
jgi:hypothetical protein